MARAFTLAVLLTLPAFAQTDQLRARVCVNRVTGAWTYAAKTPPVCVPKTPKEIERADPLNICGACQEVVMWSYACDSLGMMDCAPLAQMTLPRAPLADQVRVRFDGEIVRKGMVHWRWRDVTHDTLTFYSTRFFIKPEDRK